MNDINCPYCDHEQNICHDDGFGYEEDVFHEKQCGACEKHFTFTTYVSFSYTAHKADCLNDGKHVWKRQYTIMRCQTCEETREPTKNEWAEIWGREEP